MPVCQNLTQRVFEDPNSKHLIMQPSPECMKAINEPECGHCTYIRSGKEIYVGENEKNFLNGKPWSEVKRKAVIVPAESYEQVTTYMINECKSSNCDAEVTRFKVNLRYR